MFFCLRRILVDAYVDAKQDSLVRSAAVFIDRYNLLVPPSKCWRHATVRTDRCQSQMLVRNRDFHLPHLHWTSMLRRFSSEYCHKVLFGKTVTIQTWKKFEDIFTGFDRMHKRDRQTDGQTSHDGMVALRHIARQISSDFDEIWSSTANLEPTTVTWPKMNF